MSKVDSYPSIKLAVLVAVYNEANHIRSLLEELQSKLPYSIVVVDDGSSDGSVDEIKKVPGIELIDLKTNQGKGKALRKGFEILSQRDLDWILIMDGDGQHLPDDAMNFIDQLDDSRIGVVNGNRLVNPKKMPKVRLWTNKFMSWLVGKILGQTIHDAQCGYKLLSTSFLNEASLTADKFEIEDDLLLEAGRLNYAIRFAPVTVVYADEVSHIHPWRDTVRFAKFLHQWKRRNRRGKS